jgi:hypothetical protein
VFRKEWETDIMLHTEDSKHAPVCPNLRVP